MNYKFSLTRLTRSAKFKCWGSIKTQILINRILNKTEVQHFFAFFFHVHLLIVSIGFLLPEIVISKIAGLKFHCSCPANTSLGEDVLRRR